jgi:hypothetical protein
MNIFEVLRHDQPNLPSLATTSPVTIAKTHWPSQWYHAV